MRRCAVRVAAQGVMKLKQSAYAADYRPIDPTCSCAVCARYSRAYLHSIVTRQPRASALVSYHNLSYMMRFTRDMRAAIEAGELEGWVQDFVRTQTPQQPQGVVPRWVREALEVAGIAV